MRRDFLGIVLAGGRSRRMGRDKATLVLHGATLLDRAIATLREAGASDVCVSGDRPSHAGVPDASPNLGPVGGLATVIAGRPDGAVLVIAVDQPHLDARALRPLMDALEGAPGAAYRGHPLPFAFRLDAAARAGLAAVLAAAPGGPSMRDLQRSLGVVELSAPGGKVLSNANTPADWAELQA